MSCWTGPVLEFSTLVDADAHGFTLSGSGTATVTTPPAYIPHGEYAVTLDAGQGPQRSLLRSSAGGRLSIRVPLGPANPDQQYTEAAKNAGGTRVYSVAVTIGTAAARAATGRQPAAP